ncbi:MAG TPA: FxsA family protein [Methylophilaceae bacterium]|jgi:UPF0716 protein FxsA
MRFPLIGLLLLIFPILEIWGLIELASRYGWWVLFYVVVVAMLGWRLIQDEKLLFAGRMMQNLTQGSSVGGALFGTAKNMIAGILLIIPGVITDVLAVILLLIPSPGSAQNNPRRNAADKTSDTQFTKHNQAANDDVIEGEFRREDD